MDESLKQRIVGALVVLAVIVIFVPVLFNKDRIEPLDRTTQIPLSPKIEKIEMNFPKIDTSKEFDTAPILSEAFVPKEEEVIEVTPEVRESASIKGTSKDKAGVPFAWVLQVASFTDKTKAQTLRDTLIKDGYTSFIKVAETKKGERARVFVGPKINKNTLLKDKDIIEKKYKVQTLLIRVKP